MPFVARLLFQGEATEEQYRAIQREVIATENALKSLENQAKENNITLEKVGEAFGKIGDVSTNLGKKMLPAFQRPRFCRWYYLTHCARQFRNGCFS